MRTDPCQKQSPLLLPRPTGWPPFRNQKDPHLRLLVRGFADLQVLLPQPLYAQAAANCNSLLAPSLVLDSGCSQFAKCKGNKLVSHSFAALHPPAPLARGGNTHPARLRKGPLQKVELLLAESGEATLAKINRRTKKPIRSSLFEPRGLPL